MLSKKKENPHQNKKNMSLYRRNPYSLMCPTVDIPPKCRWCYIQDLMMDYPPPQYYSAPHCCEQLYLAQVPRHLHPDAIRRVLQWALQQMFPQAHSFVQEVTKFERDGTQHSIFTNDAEWLCRLSKRIFFDHNTDVVYVNVDHALHPNYESFDLSGVTSKNDGRTTWVIERKRNLSKVIGFQRRMF